MVSPATSFPHPFPAVHRKPSLFYDAYARFDARQHALAGRPLARGTWSSVIARTVIRRTGSILVQVSALESPMRTEVDLTKLTPRQCEVLTALARRLSKSEVVRLLQIAEATTPSAVAISEATMLAILDRAKAVIEDGSASKPPEAPGSR